MSYYFSTMINAEFEDAVERAKDALIVQGFGILTEIDVTATMKKKLDRDFRPYVILGACNPPFAYKALMAEDKIGTMLPCNVIVQQLTPGSVEIAAVDPVASMQAIENESLGSIAEQVRGKLKAAIDSL